MSKLTNLSAMLVVSSLLAGCDPAMTPDQAGESPADALSQGAGDEFGTTQQGLTVVSTGSWSGTDEPPVALGSASDRICFLTKMTGNFAGAGDIIGTSILWGRWWVGGTGTTAVSAFARCVPLTTGSSAQEFSWSQGNPMVNMGTATGRVCFLTQVQGHFNGWGENVETYVSGGNWYLRGASQTQGVAAKARCVNADSYSGEYSWAQGQPSTPMDNGATTRACALTYVQGRFKGYGEKVEITLDQGGTWYLGGSSQQLYVGARARCF